ncbi:FKBP-type peptidyl-prolyl cis-trans isomerase [Hymenobacter busanensis]|uniref:Peptidyl-prolyl cis-trans isomerase n=1 Tax=Hymenobacter busanensis TaxID=2607656 RepID=A0A7L5A1U8_9BACT|nr:FKBP-type peptidyl-prolyl cis-trans isomerase [Hymenobacter busanensis]KAA9325307.1 FKBP-type peptidyl-prolyl cis-trans isomerase [Hymenobacter busanensis]QHJ07700.1 hypothetical protein GUY19_10540 [Hymenobacter busanensis]
MRTLFPFPFPSLSRSLCGLLALLLPLALLTASCKKDDDTYTKLIEEHKALDEQAFKDYLAKQNYSPADVVRRESGLYIIYTKRNPNAVQVQVGNKVKAQYVGQFLNGNTFDSSYDNSICQCYGFQVGAGTVIKGWEEAFPQLRKGEEAKLLVPSHLAYGPSGTGSIPPYTPIMFDVVVADVVK